MEFLLMLLGLGGLFGRMGGSSAAQASADGATESMAAARQAAMPETRVDGPIPVPRAQAAMTDTDISCPPIPDPQDIVWPTLDEPDTAPVVERLPEFKTLLAEARAAGAAERSGTVGDDVLRAGDGGEILQGNGGGDKIEGGDGNDLIDALDGTGDIGLYGGKGDDVIRSSVPMKGQAHIGGEDGDDRIILDLTNVEGYHGHHVYGGTGNDTIEFTGIDRVEKTVLGRIDDFDPSRDVIAVDGEVLDLSDLPEGVDVVSYNGQQWLRIEDKALYALEGAREGGNERHFTQLPDDISTLEVVEFMDQRNYVPEDSGAMPDRVIGVYGDGATGTSGDDWIRDEQVNPKKDGVRIEKSPSLIEAGGGNDVVDAGKGDDTVEGGAGDDRLAGGMDDDILRGGAGKDTLWGGSEDDTLDGGAGADVLEGDRGADVFVAGGGDRVLDFEAGLDRLMFGAETEVTGADDLEMFRIEDADGNEVFAIRMIPVDETFEVAGASSEEDLLEGALFG